VVFWMVMTYIAICIGAGWSRSFSAEGARGYRSHGTHRRADADAEPEACRDLPEAAFASAVRGDPVSVVMMDLDRFKEVNDRHGHRAGDEVLRAFAEALQTVTRRMDLSARWGGEEFLSVLHHCTGEGAEIFLGRLRKDSSSRIGFPGGGSPSPPASPSTPRA
jgi:hypothetical protein